MNTIDTIITRFRTEGKHVLARALERTKTMTIDEYTSTLFQYIPNSEYIELELKEAFLFEFKKQGLSEEDAYICLSQLIQQRSLQTAHHVGLVQSPRMFCIDWLTVQGLKNDEWYLVGAFSGVPFSNSSRPGRITFSGNEVNLVPKTYQDALVFSATISDKTIEQWVNLPLDIHKSLPEPIYGSSYSHWALSVLGTITRKNLNHQKILYFDINHVISHYIVALLKNNHTQHPIYRILLDPIFQKTVLDSLGSHIHFFYSPYDKGKYQKQESLYIDGKGFQGEYNYYACDRETLIKALESRELCPATFLTFTILAGINQFQCFGSFSQVEYLTEFKAVWKDLKIAPFETIESIPTDTLTTAMFPADRNLQPLDVFLGNKTIPGSKNDILATYYETIWQQ